MFSAKEGLSGRQVPSDYVNSDYTPIQINFLLDTIAILLEAVLNTISPGGPEYDTDGNLILTIPKGDQGPQGNTGGTGGIGPRGPKGDQGKIGIDGRDGASIFDASKIMLNGETKLNRGKKRHKNRDDDKDAPEPSTAYTTLFA